MAGAVLRHRRHHIDADADLHVGRGIGGITHAHAAVIHAAHRPMVRAGHLAHTGPPAGHAHIVHTECRALPPGRDGCRHTHSRGPGAAGHTRAVHRFPDDREGTVLAGLPDHIIVFPAGE